MSANSNFDNEDKIVCLNLFKDKIDQILAIRNQSLNRIIMITGKESFLSEN